MRSGSTRTTTRRLGTIRVTERRRVPIPQDIVFGYAADFGNIEKWDPGVASSRRLSTGPDRVGTRFELRVRLGGGTTPMVYEIATIEPPHRIALVGIGPKLHAYDEIRFVAENDTTVIDYTADITFLNWFGYLGPLLKPVLRRVGKRALDGLVDELTA